MSTQLDPSKSTPPGPPDSPHSADHPHDDEHPELTARNARSGWWLFLIYLLLYGGFVGLCTLAPQLMGARMPGGVNVAVAYGVGLIAAAGVLAMVYMYQCKVAAGEHAAELTQREADARSDAGGRPK